jgi:hypothetical protein
MADEWLTVREAAGRLGRSTRQTHRYAQGDAPRIRTRRKGTRILFHAADVAALAGELAELDDTPPASPAEATQLLPPGETLALIRDIQDRLMFASRRVGELEAQLSQRLLPEDADELRTRAAAAERENDRLRAELAQARRPWWKRLLS